MTEHFTLIEGFQLSKQRRNVPFAAATQTQSQSSNTAVVSAVFAVPLPPAVSAHAHRSTSIASTSVSNESEASVPDSNSRVKRLRFVSERTESAETAAPEEQQLVAKMSEETSPEKKRQIEAEQNDSIAEASGAILPQSDEGDVLADAVAVTAQCFRDIRTTAKALAEGLEEKLALFESYAIEKFQEFEEKRRSLAELEDRIRVVQDVARKYDKLFE